MTNTSRIAWWLLIISLAIILDLLVLRIFRVYRQILNAAKVDGQKANSLRILKEAITTAFPNLPSRNALAHKLGPQSEDSPENDQNRKPLSSPWHQRKLVHWSITNLALAALTIYAGQYLMIHIPNSREWGLAVLSGGILLAYVRLKVEPPRVPNRRDWFQVGMGFLICLTLALNIDNWSVEVAPRIQIALWLLSIILVAAPALKLNHPKVGSGWPRVGPLTRSEWGLLIVLTLGALLLRLPALESIPGPVDPDEASLGLFFKDVAEGRYKGPFGTGWATHPALQFFFIVPLTHIFEKPLFLMRIPSVIYGTLAVGALYLAARAGWGRRVALFTGVLMMSSDVAIHFSRLGVNNISDSLFASATMAALWIALSTGNPLAYVLTGAGMGLAQYYYFGNRAIPFIFIASLILWGFLNRRQFRTAWVPLLHVTLVFLVVAGPLLGLWVREPQTMDRVTRVATLFTKKWENQADQNDQSLAELRWEQVRDSLLVFTVLPDRGSFYNAGRAMLPSLLAPLFIIGLIVLFAKWRQPASLSTLAWLFVILTLGSVMINTAATFQRLLGLYPAVLLVTAIGLETSVVALYQRLPIKSITPGRIAYIFISITAVSSVYFYFNTFNNHRVWKPPDYDTAAILAREYEKLDGQGTFVLQTLLGVGDDGTIYLPLIKLLDDDDIRGKASQVEAAADERPLRFYIFHDKFDDLPGIQERFPGGEVKKYLRKADGELILIRYTVP
jgi:4-amino-4-deoxy-L-arabinose transferase-like glycosyltransferase